MNNRFAKPDFNLLLQSYRVGLIYSWEFIFRYMDHLNALGAGKQLMDILDLELRPFADYLSDILDGNGNLIEDYRNPVLTK